MAINTEIKPTSDQVLYQGLGPLDVKNTPVETVSDLPSNLVAYEGLTVPVKDDPEYHEMTDWWYKDGSWRRKTQKQKKKVDKNWQINKVVIKKAIPRYDDWENGVTYFSEDGTFTFKARYCTTKYVDAIDLDQLYYLQDEEYNMYAGKEYIDELVSEPYIEQSGQRMFNYTFEDCEITDVNEFYECPFAERGMVIQFTGNPNVRDAWFFTSKRFYLSTKHFAIYDSRHLHQWFENLDNCPKYIRFGAYKDGVRSRHFLIQIDGLYSAFEHNHTTDSEYDDDFNPPNFSGMDVLVRLRFKDKNAIHKRNGQVFLAYIKDSDTMSPNVKIADGKIIYDAKWDNSFNTNLIQNWYNTGDITLHNYNSAYGREALDNMWSHSYIEKYQCRKAKPYRELCHYYNTPGLYDSGRGYYGLQPWREPHNYLLVVDSIGQALNAKLPSKIGTPDNLRIKVLDSFYVKGETIRGMYLPTSLNKDKSGDYYISNRSSLQELVLKYRLKHWYPYFMNRKIYGLGGNWFCRCQRDWKQDLTKRGGVFRLYPVNRRKRLISVNYTQLSLPRNAAEKTWNH